MLSVENLKSIEKSDSYHGDNYFSWNVCDMFYLSRIRSGHISMLDGCSACKFQLRFHVEKKKKKVDVGSAKLNYRYHLQC